MWYYLPDGSFSYALNMIMDIKEFFSYDNSILICFS